MHAITCLAAWALALPQIAAEKFDVDGRAAALAPLIDAETFALVRFDATKVDADGFMKSLTTLFPGRKDDLKYLGGILKAAHAAFTAAGGSELVLVFSTADVPHMSFVHVPLKGDANEVALTLLLKGWLGGWAKVEKRGDALVAGSSRALARLAKAKPSPRTELAPAVAAAGDGAVQALLLPSEDARRVVAELVTLPEALGGSGKVLTRGVRWAALSLDAGAKPALRATIHSADAAAAKGLVALTQAGYAALAKATFFGEDKPLAELMPKEFDAAIAALQPIVAGDTVTLEVSDPAALRALANLYNAADERIDGWSGSDTNTQNLKRLLIALHNYHSVHNAFPPHAVYSKAGKPLLSWRVALLPFLDEDKLYQEFHRDEPWDSEHNKKLIEKMPKVFRCPKSKDRRPGQTTYLAPVGKQLIFTGEAKGSSINDIKDGTSNTIAVVDAGDDAGVVWTKPADLIVDMADPLKGLLGHYPGFFLVGWADGSVSRVVKNIAPKVLWAAFTRDGGEVLPAEGLK